MSEKDPGSAPVPDGSQPLPDGLANPFGPANPNGAPSQLAGIDPALTGRPNTEADPAAPPSPDAAGGSADGSGGGTESDPAATDPASPDLTDTAAIPVVKTGDTIVMPAVPDTGESGSTPVESKDRMARYKDALLLNNSFRFRRKIHEVGTQVIKGVQFSKAKIANSTEFPGEWKWGIAHSFAKRGLEGRQARLRQARNSAQWTIRNQKVVAAQNKVDTRKAKRDEHIDRRHGRIATVLDNETNRRDGYKAELVQRKKDALVRKEVRKASELTRFRPRDRRELAQIIALVDKERLETLANVAIETHATIHVRKIAERTEKGAGRHQKWAQGRVDRVGERITGYDGKVAEAEERLKELNEKDVPSTSVRVKALRTELQNAGDNEEEKTRIAAELEKAEEEEKSNIVSLKEWKDVKSKNLRRSGHATKRSATLNTRLTERKAAAQRATKRAEEWREAELDDREHLEDEVVVALNPRRPVTTSSDEAGKAA